MSSVSLIAGQLYRVVYTPFYGAKPEELFLRFLGIEARVAYSYYVFESPTGRSFYKLKFSQFKAYAI